MPDDPRHQIACLSCLAAQLRLRGPCHKRGSRKLASVWFLIQQHGKEWRLILEAEKGRVH